MIRQLEDVNEGATTPKGKPPCKAIKGQHSIIDKPGFARAKLAYLMYLKGERGRRRGV
jgi:hypothetical protein